MSEIYICITIAFLSWFLVEIASIIFREKFFWIIFVFVFLYTTYTTKGG